MPTKKPVKRPTKKQNQSKQIEMATFLNQRSLKRRLVHGGDIRKGRRKEHRPLSTKDPIHLVLRSSKARGEMSFLRKANRSIVEGILRSKAKKFGVAIHQLVNVGNHFHLEVKITARKEFQKFLISVTGLIARQLTGARRGHKFGKFWDHLAFTRVVKTSYEHWILRTYLKANAVEAAAGPFARAQFLDAWYGYGPPDKLVVHGAEG